MIVNEERGEMFGTDENRRGFFSTDHGSRLKNGRVTGRFAWVFDYFNPHHTLHFIHHSFISFSIIVCPVIFFGKQLI